MNTAEYYRKLCLKQQSELRLILMDLSLYDQAMALFLSQHAMLHSAKMAHTELWSFEDEVLDDLPEALVRRIPQGGEHSIAWLIWHMARCEDVTMNLLVAGSPQTLLQDKWLEQMKINVCDTGNAMVDEEIMNFSLAIDLGALRAYRLAVGRRTQEIVKELQPVDLMKKVDPVRLQRVLDEGAVADEARGIVDYWGGRKIAGLLLMPATRHNLIHLNEGLKLKRKLLG